MTLLTKMAAISVDKKVVNVNQPTAYGPGEGQRVRPERASSLALPHSSLLDFYDKQQEQCNSVALLPPSAANVAARRHSSHYYPVLEHKPHQLQYPQQQQYKLQQAMQQQTKKQQQQQQQQQQHQRQQQQAPPSQRSESTATAITAAALKLHNQATSWASLSSSAVAAGVNIAGSAFTKSLATHFNFKKTHDLLLHEMQSPAAHASPSPASAAAAAARPSAPTPAPVTKPPQPPAPLLLQVNAAGTASSRQSTLGASSPPPSSSPSPPPSPSPTPTPSATPPPPVPKRTFRGKFVWSAVLNGSPSASLTPTSTPTPTPPSSASTTQTPTKAKRPTTTTGTGTGTGAGAGAGAGTAFVYPQPQQQLQQRPLYTGAGGYCDHNGSDAAHSEAHSRKRSLFSVDGVGYDGGAVSDDDHTSLDNSVFEESLNSTPVKASAAKLLNHTLAARSLAALTADLSNAAKRSNRSSSSTVDSSITSSGYGSHSERLASTSTTAEIRSRLSSVDTQSSLDSCLTEKTTDCVLAKDHCKTDQRATFSGPVHSLNNNDNNNNNNNKNNNNNNNSSIDGTTNNNNNNNDVNRGGVGGKGTAKLPAVPVRKQSAVRAKFGAAQPQTNRQSAVSVSQQSLTNSGSGSGSCSSSGSDSNSTPTPSTVSSSTSTSSTASACSGTSPGSATSIPAAASNAPLPPFISPQLQQQQQQQQQKRPMPPLPPARVQSSEPNDPATRSPHPAPPPPPTTAPAAPPTARNKLNRRKPPPIVQPKLHQRQDSNLSSDSFSVSSSPGYNSKHPMDTPLLETAAAIDQSVAGLAEDFGLPPAERNAYAGVMVMPPQPPQAPQPLRPLQPSQAPTRNKHNYRQDSAISSDSSSPGYNTKIMEAPLLPSLSVKRLCSVPTPIVCKQKFQHETIEELDCPAPISPLTKCVSTPASLQTIVRFQNGSPNTMPLQHQIIDRRKSSNPYITNGRLKFRLFQILLNAFALLAIAGGLAAYFNAYPTIRFVNKTIINTIHVEEVSSFGKNPAPGTCLPIIVKFCQGPQIPYNYTVFPNYIGHFGQLETQVDLDAYEALVDVRCYELVSLFLCTLFVPKCGSTGATVPPCRTLCTETMRRCGFFFDVFGLSLPEYLNCKLFKDFESADDCVGFDQVRDVMIASANPKCDGFQCDQNRCIPNAYVCDGQLDCMDQADEASCERCAKDEIYCGGDSCVSARHICDGTIDCPFGQDERNCIRLSERNGDLGKGVLEVYRISSNEWTPACVKNWDRAVSPTAVCSMLGYSSVNATSVVTQRTHRPLLTSVNVSTDIWKMYAKKRSNLMREFSNCTPDEDYPIAELTCSNYECGKVKQLRSRKPSKRIIGGSQANPGTWPFLAAILGGPEKIFYCAGVLISDQWVLTASHCIGNHTVIDLEDWTIQLGVTRRNSFTYSGQKVKVKTVIPHPQYNIAIAHDNDIALFQLATRVAFHEHLLPVCLPPASVKQLRPDQLCTVIGWGKKEDKDPKSTYEPIVNEVQVPIIRRQQCDEWLDNLTVSNGMICAGYEEGGKDACQGDSGGPLLCPYPGEKDRWFVGGIVSWGIMCAHPKLPGVYANVIKYVPWINEQIQKYSKPPGEERFSKYDAHPGGPDILSNMATGPVRSRKPFKIQNRSPMDIDFYESDEKT